jgi:glycosyltransferase involved in cell wall biosynthesis
MSNSPQFNYIITIHNKETLIKEVINCLLICGRDNSHIYPVLDGCTDQTEAIIDDLIKTFSHVPITKVYTPDVHEILAINAGLRAADQTGDGYNIILQDDVLLHDFLLQEKITRLYEWARPKLGFLSFRHGANLTPNPAAFSGIYPFKQYVENAYGHGLPQAEVLLPGHLAYRNIVIKSPVCIPFELTRTVGLLEEKLAPYMCDDIEYSIRSAKAGYQNGVFALRFQSDVEWGTTRTNPDSRHSQLETRNMEFIKQWHGSEIERIANAEQMDDIVEVPNMATERDTAIALEALKRNREQLELFFSRQTHSNFLDRVRNKVKGTLKKLVPAYSTANNS